MRGSSFRSMRWLLAALSLLASTLLLPGGGARAQSGSEPLQVQLVNLSHSGAASEPVLLTTPQGRVQIFWWDAFDGLMTLIEEQGAQPQPAPVLVPMQEQGKNVLNPTELMPTITGDAVGRAHALWLGPPNPESKLQPLLHSTLQLGTTGWSTPVQLTESASAWYLLTGPQGEMHLFFFRPTHTDTFPAGLYHQISGDDGATWSAPVAIERSLHFRRTTPENGHLEAAVDPQGNVYVTWDDPQSGEAVYSRWSVDARWAATRQSGGWSEPQPFHRGKPTARRARLVVTGDGELLVLWEASGILASGALYQQRSLDNAKTWRAPQRVLEDLAGTAGLSLWTAGKGRVLLCAGGRTGQLVLAMWDVNHWHPPEESGWSDRLFLPLTTSGQDVGPTVEVGRWHGVLMRGQLTLAGQGQDGEVWATRIPTDTIRWAYAPPPPWSILTPAPSEMPSGWSAPVNLSQSGSASMPVVLPGPKGSCQVFWWDHFDGLTSAFYDGRSWFAALPSPIMVTTPMGDEVVSRPVETMPRLAADANGQVHALWLGAADVRSGLRPLLHSKLLIGTTKWSLPTAIADAALTWELVSDRRGILHLIYIRDVNTPTQPAGIYYLRSVDGGVSWSPPQLLLASVYVRLLTPESAHLALAADEAGHVFATWDDPRSGQAIYTRSGNGGISWEEPRPVSASDARAQRARLVITRAEEILLLWESAGTMGGTGLYQRRSTDGGETWDMSQRVLEELHPPLEGTSFYQAPQGYLLLVIGGGSSRLTIAAWDSARAANSAAAGWSDPEAVAFSFQTPQTGVPVYLEALQGALCGEAFIVAGQGQDGEVWAAERSAEAEQWVFAPPPPWSPPDKVADVVELAGAPAVAVDKDGTLHVLWSEAEEPTKTRLHYARWDGSRWTRAYGVIRLGEERLAQPSLVAVGERLHAVASAGPGGRIVYARAFLRDAYAAGGWSTPQPLPAPARAQGVGGSPIIRADLSGNLYVVYAVPLNEGRGIYYTHSRDGGESWAQVSTVFDAEKAGWAMVDHPSLAVDVDGTLHVAWVRMPLPGNPIPEGIYYSQSTDEGQSWSEPLLMAEGAYDWPQLGISRPQIVHLLWSEVSGRKGWSHRKSTNGGRQWAPTSSVSGLREVAGPAILVYDGFQSFYLLGPGVGDAGEPALVQSAWDHDNQRWLARESYPQGAEVQSLERVAGVVMPKLGQLHVVLWGTMATAEGTVSEALLYTQRAVTPLTLDVQVYITPQPTAPPTPTPLPTPTPTPRPTVNVQPPPPTPPGIEVGPLSLPLGALLGVLLVGALVVGVLLVRSMRQRR